MPRGFPTPLPQANIPQLIKRIRRRHKAADDPQRDEFPDPEDEAALFAVVLFARRRFRALLRRDRPTEVAERLTLIRHGRRALDAEELAAIRDGRACGMTWKQIGAPLGITTKNGVVQRMQRLQVLTELGDRVPRHPRTLRDHHLAQATDQQRLTMWVARRHREVRVVAHKLLQYRLALSTDDDTDEWLDDLDLLLEAEDTGETRASIASHLLFAVRGIEECASQSGQPPTTDAAARAALRAAADIAQQFHDRLL